MTHSLDYGWDDLAPGVGGKCREVIGVIQQALELRDRVTEMQGALSLADFTTQLAPIGATAAIREGMVQDALDALDVFNQLNRALTNQTVATDDRIAVLRRLV